jgi:hypothetical protein
MTDENGLIRGSLGDNRESIRGQKAEFHGKLMI